MWSRLIHAACSTPGEEDFRSCAVGAGRRRLRNCPLGGDFIGAAVAAPVENENVQKSDSETRQQKFPSQSFPEHTGGQDHKIIVFL
jgi:hypothetical protein